MEIKVLSQENGMAEVQINLPGADLTAATGSLNETESSASGDKSDNNKAGLAPAFWIFTVLTILMFLVLLWSGMKRGVFSRRN